MATRGAPPTAGVPAKVASAPPNQTLYVTNLPSNKIKKEDLRTELYLLFSTYGSVLDVVALKTMKMRGQAHIVYKDIQTATQAMRALDGFEFFGLNIVNTADTFLPTLCLPSNANHCNRKSPTQREDQTSFLSSTAHSTHLSHQSARQS